MTADAKGACNKLLDHLSEHLDKKEYVVVSSSRAAELQWVTSDQGTTKVFMRNSQRTVLNQLRDKVRSPTLKQVIVRTSRSGAGETRR